MVGVRLTPAQAKALGIDPGEYDDASAAIATPRPKRRRKAEPYATVCTDCGEAFSTRAAETRHLNATRHCAYQLTLDLRHTVR